LRRIRSLFQRFNRRYFGGIIPVPEFELSRRLRLSGYVHVCDGFWRMVLSIPYHDRYGWGRELAGTIKHEMVHLFLKLKHRPYGHTREFRRLCRAVGGSDYSKALPTRFRYLYQCPQCRQLFRYRVQVRLACAACSRPPRRSWAWLKLKRSLVGGRRAA
jgi:predicted SprT family Zn-dependent metalloprotease